ncbi:Putative AC transposase, partial [Linum perenne]
LSEFDIYASDEHGVHNGKEEFDTYISDGLIPRSGEFDILAWWKSNGSKYPTLTLIARDILAVPVSTVVSEAAFSTCGRLLSPCRSRLEEETIEALMCSQNWLRNQIKGASTNILPTLNLMNTIMDEENDGDFEDEVEDPNIDL